MPRLQFRLSTLLWITLAVACWFGGTMRSTGVTEVLREKNETLGLMLGALRQHDLDLEQEIRDLKANHPEPPAK